jgi:hypothetical protein
MTMNQQSSSSLKKYTHIAPAALVAVGVIVGVVGADLFRGSPAAAQPREGTIAPENILSAGGQRAQMITALNAMNERLGRVEAKLNGPLNVKVIEMPAIKVDGK